MKTGIAAVIGLMALGLILQRAQAIDGSQRIICGANDRNEIWCTTYQGMEHGKWERLPGSLKQVVVRGGHLWGINAAGEIYYAADFRNTNWVHLEGSAKEISEGNGVLCVSSKTDEIWCADQGITTPHPQWKRAPDDAKLKSISIN